MTQAEAQAHCGQQGMELAKPLTTKELNALVSFVEQTDGSMRGRTDRRVHWTGLTRTKNGATDEVTDVGGKWEDGIFANPSGDGTCIEITNHGEFNDLPCKARRPAICQTGSMYICHQ